MSDILIIPKRIVTADHQRRILRNYCVEIQDDRIKSIEKILPEK